MNEKVKIQARGEIVKNGELGDVPFEIRGGEAVYYRDEGSEEHRTEGRRREVLDVDARQGRAVVIIGDNKFVLERGTRLTIETTESEPNVTRIEKPKTLVSYRAAETRTPLCSGTAVRYLRIFGIQLRKTGEYDFDQRTWEEIKALHRKGWETPNVRIEG